MSARNQVLFGAIALGSTAIAFSAMQAIQAIPSSEEVKSYSQMQLAQQQTFPFDGKPVYVLHNGTWREAFLMGWNWSSNEGEKYTVRYADDNSTEEGVTVERIRTLAQAQQNGVATNVYDLSSQAGIEQMVNAHNQWRSQVGVRPLRWSPQLASYAQSWADRLAQNNRFEHRQNSPYGENLASSTGRQMSPTRVVEMWGNEVRDYDYASNSCAPGKVCGHYTQIVWANTTEVGCGVARSGDREVWVCNYNPPGNFIGQKPY